MQTNKKGRTPTKCVIGSVITLNSQIINFLRFAVDVFFFFFINTYKPRECFIIICIVNRSWRRIRYLMYIRRATLESHIFLNFGSIYLNVLTPFCIEYIRIYIIAYLESESMNSSAIINVTIVNSKTVIQMNKQHSISL